jgi:prepilin-type N-terminal cleavage/methylation domain-containing protein
MCDLNKNYCNENCSSTELPTRAIGVDFCNRKLWKVSGFTLVELLVVVAIIGILAALITAASFRVIATTRVTTVRMKINELEYALEQYKNKFGEYPPMLNDTPAVTRHLKKRWPRLDAAATTAAMNVIAATNKDSLVFWLGGFRNIDGKYCGFGVDKANPFGGALDGANSGAYDNEVFIELIQDTNVKLDRTIVDSTRDKMRVIISMGGKDYPVVYFRGKKGGGIEAYRNSNDSNNIWQETTSCGIAAPYSKVLDKWHNPETFQLIHPGFDGRFGEEPPPSNGKITGDGLNLDDHDYDNITNLGTSTIEALLP